jgi:hypothetical protein
MQRKQYFREEPRANGDVGGQEVMIMEEGK